MAKRHRDFGSATVRNKTPYTFTLNGEYFTAVPVAPAAALDDMASGVSLSEDGTKVYSAPSLIKFMRQVLQETEELTIDQAKAKGIEVDEEDEANGMIEVATDDVARFDDLVHNKRNAVDIGDLGDVVMWLGEMYGNRPTVPPGR